MTLPWPVWAQWLEVHRVRSQSRAHTWAAGLTPGPGWGPCGGNQLIGPSHLDVVKIF